MYAALDFARIIFTPGSGRLVPQFGPRVFGMKFGELAEEILGLLVRYFGSLDCDLDNLVAALVLACVEDSLFAHAEFLTILGPRRDLENRLSFDGGNLN